ncbi:MAG: hypothetical protein ACI4W1_07440 [Ruminococcus sp.]
MNKKVLFYDIFIFSLGILFLISVQLFYKFFESTNLVLNITYTVLLIVLVIVSILFYTLKQWNEKLSVINIIIPAVLFVLYYIIYCLPFFSFNIVRGIDDTVCMSFLFLIGTHVINNVSLLLSGKENKNTETNTNNSYKVFIYFADFILCFTIIGIIANSFLSVIDMSLYYNILVLHKPLSELGW